MKISVTKPIDRTDALSKVVKDLTKLRVLVGVPAADASRADGEPINNAALAYIHNYGSPAANIPARPFMEPGIKAAEDEIVAALRFSATAALRGDTQAVDAGLNRAGIVAQESIRHEINDGDFAPLAPATVADRLAHGFDSDKPLIRSGAMRNSITYVIRKGSSRK